MCYAGTVDSVIIRDGIPYVVVGTVAISVSDVLQVFGTPLDGTTSEDVDTTPDTI
jgi:hypothetical protein